MKLCSFKTVAFWLALVLFHGCASTTHDHQVNSAYRPSSEAAEQFIKDLAAARVAIYPSVIRSLEGTAYSESSQKKLVSLLNEKRVTTAVAAADTIKLPALKVGSQWQMFKTDLQAIAESLQSKKPDADYSLLMEFVFAPGNKELFGIHCYVFDLQGNNVFSFLMNSHHKPFVDANLVAGDSSEASRARLVEKATRVGVSALVEQVSVPLQADTRNRQGYSVTSQKLASFDKPVARIFVITRIDEVLVPVFMRSFRHSLISAFESNDVATAFKYLRRESGDYAKFDSEVESFAPDAVMYIDLDGLYRKRKDGPPALAGTDFEAKVVDPASEEIAWQAKGRVDYIADSFLNRSNYTAHEGIRKEFAWHTTAAIVRTFTLDVNGHKSAPIYTVTEDREIYQQRTD